MSFLDKERTVAGPGFDRWLVPPAALAIHLCIGMAYGFSVFWLPLSRAIGVSKPVACPADITFLARITSAACDWNVSALSLMYTMFFVLLGISAAVWGGWLERVGPRKAGVVSALCWCGGLLISALGVYIHQIWLLWLGSGVIGGIGLGLGYISPVSTLIKWFPDRRGLATGMAIMGFGGGALVGSPLAAALMKYFSSATSVGVWQTFVVMAIIYLVFMMAGALSYRIPPSGWKPLNFVPVASTSQMVTSRHVHASRVWGIPQFWLVWLVLFLNVSAGIGIIGMASPMLQEVFGGRLIGVPKALADLSADQKIAMAAVAAGFTGLISLFNIVGRLFWASVSDFTGRKMTHAIFFMLGLILYVSLPSSGKLGSMVMFVGAVCIIISMYGGGFATAPAYLADLFGTQMVGAIHGRLLTAWATAGIVGPVLVTSMREYQMSLGAAPSQVYNTTMYILAGLLVLGFICNLMIRPVADKYFMTPDELTAEKKKAHEKITTDMTGAGGAADMDHVGSGGHPVAIGIAWLVVLVPIGWGVISTLRQVAVMMG